ncbi:SDR family NAD(P)-dependent oxidoreductase [Peristeroidobacter soli]|uniref:SDR family NAD(P)-dependent oxidoreductase n=1 Tax=Peristeroidobacter soli TaxID=2497877 RepID=UPI00101D42A9|nr:SDR family NAD(P)-dependent oxidoreductase [Peristeroidobacter soli]
MIHLQGQVVVITGAGRGIGRSHALAFATRGARVVVNDLGVSYDGARETLSPADSVVEEIRRAGGEAIADYNDISNWDGAQALLDGALRAFNRVDTLVNNAAIIRPAPLTDTTARDLDDVVRVNVKGTFAPLQVFAAHWKTEGTRSPGGHSRSVICTTSRVGFRPAPYYVVYGLTKSAVAYLVEGAAAELAGLGIRVNGIAPRADTRMMGDATRRLNEIAGSVGIAGVFGDSSATERPAEPVESISPLVLWLASAASRAVTGAIFSVMAGRIALLDGRHERSVFTLPVTHTPEDVDHALSGLEAP